MGASKIDEIFDRVMPMSSESPKPPLPDAIRKKTEDLEKFAQWIAELIRRRHWFTLLLLIDVTLILFCIPGGVVPQFLSGFGLDLPGWYGRLFWLAVAGIFLAALGVAIATMPSEEEEDNFVERKAIKGLRPFTREDAEIFSRLQRDRDVAECLNALKGSSYRFGYLVGESGCGKTSFLQAGLLPKLEEAIAFCGVYIRFSDRDPLETIREAFHKQLNLESTVTGGFLALVKAAAAKPLILLFDQFEQFFVQCKYEGDRQPFIQGLKEWYECPEKPAVKIVFSIRADLYYNLIEIEQALGYSPSPFEVCRLKKFSPQQATDVLGVIAETERLEFDRVFIEKMSQQELASREDGLISPVDLQILAWMLERENTEQLRAFNEKAFQRLGGIEGLLRRYLEKVLETRTLASQRQATIKVLLALTDLERQVRGGVLTVAELGEKLKETVQPREIAEATVWLARGDVRLISAVRGEGKKGYELAHERMIPALMQLSGKELTAADRANQLLDARVNEWLGSNGKSRYLFDLRELWAIERQKPYLIWGAKREQKERLLRLSKRRIYGVTGAGVSVVLVVGVFCGWLFFTPQGQIQQVRWTITNPLGSSLTKVEDRIAAKAAIAVAKNGQWQAAFKLIADHVNRSEDRADFLKQFAVIATRGKDSSQAKTQLKKALAEGEKINQTYSKSSALALTKISLAYIQLKDKEAAKRLLETSLDVVEKIDDPDSKSSVLRAIALAYIQLKDEEAAKELLKTSLQASEKIDTSSSSFRKSFALSSIASASGQLKDEKAAKELLKTSLNIAEKIDSPYSKFSALRAIASTYIQLKDEEVAKRLLETSLDMAEKIDFASGKSNALRESALTYIQLKDEETAKRLLKTSLDMAEKIDDPYNKSDALREIASAYGQFQDKKAVKELLKTFLNVTEKIDEPYNKSLALSSIALIHGQLQETKTAKDILFSSLKLAREIDEPVSHHIIFELTQNSPMYSFKQYKKSSALSQIASASGNLTNWEIAQEILRDTLSVAEAANASSALKEISSQYAWHDNWGKALRALRNCPESEKIEALAQILTLWAEKKNPQLIDGAVVLNLDVEGTANDYTFNVSLYSRDSGCDKYADWWEVLGEDGELLYRHVFDKSHPDEQPFTSSIESIKITEDKTVIVRAHMNDTGYEARQAWKGSVKNGFKFVRLSENFAASVTKEEPQPPECTAP